MEGTIPDLTGLAVDGSEVSLSDYFKPGRYTLLWWHPQTLTPAACKTCSGGAEPITLLQAIYQAGCDVVGLTYESPERMARYLYDIGLEYPILSVTETAAREHRAAKASGEPWASVPHRIAYLVGEDGQIINRYQVHDPTVFLRQVRDDVKNGPPSSKWEPPKKGFLARLLGR